MFSKPSPMPLRSQRIKFTDCLPERHAVSGRLNRLGHEAQHVRSIGMQRATDLEIVNHAQSVHAAVITFDLDFGEILALGVRTHPSVILLRMNDERAERVNDRLGFVIGQRLADLERGALIVIEDTRYRLRKLPIGD